MTDHSQPARRIAPATLALGVAGLLAVSAIAVAALRSGGGDTEPTANASANAIMAAGHAGSMEQMVAQLRERLRQDPDNAEGWFMLGMTYRDGEHFPEAEQAFRRAMELQPRNANYSAYLGETLLLKGGSAPPAEATTLFRRALELEPGNAQARYYLATLKDMGGDHRGAVDDLVTLLRSAPANAPWEPQVRDAVTTIAQQNHIDLANRLPPPRTPATPPATTATAAIPGPTPDQMRAASGIPPSQQDQMVRTMVDGLAARLRQNPRDAEGWVRLMRSRMVLHDEAAAGAALRSALAAFQGDTATQARLRTAASELGIPAA